ncbi:MAG: hypothetical protein A3J81_07465 [Nitrospirae bacterium RIFOXYB2_FULL_43_5]|nr:MAG: hypothetical protein A3J81_07465 [Nitrospirae bacterium RIFOXYB2_FULL_43_5]
MNRVNVNLSRLAGKIVKNLKRTQPERQVEFIIADGLFTDGDEHLLNVALENLFGNSWKFTGKLQKAMIEFGETIKDGNSVYYVKDNGAGLDMNYAGKLFTPFQRLHKEEEFPGTGIGLATVKRIIERHGGRVWIEGEIDKGALVYFTL